MTPQGWIDATEDFDEVMDSDGGIYHGHPKQFATEGATHLAAALEAIATMSPSCNRCQSAHCCSVRDESARIPLCVTDPDGSLPLWMPWTNADVQARVDPLHAEIARLRADAGRVVVPEGALYIDSAVMDSIMDTLRSIGDMAHNASTGPAVPDVFWDIRQIAYDAYLTADDSASEIVQATTPVPAGRVLKDGEVAVREAEWQAANQFITLQRKIDGGGDVDEEVEWHKGLIRAEKKLDALRTQATGEKDV